MKTTIQYKHRTPETEQKFIGYEEGIYHPDCPLLNRSHRITSLADCPFPLETSSFKVLLFGLQTEEPDSTFCVVEYTKSCGHKVQEKVTFHEHMPLYGNPDILNGPMHVTDAEYSIKNWERRIESYRTLSPCDVCRTVQDKLWRYKNRDTDSSPVKAATELRSWLDNEYANWQDFVDFTRVERDLFQIESETAHLVKQKSGFSGFLRGIGL